MTLDIGYNVLLALLIAVFSVAILKATNLSQISQWRFRTSTSIDDDPDRFFAQKARKHGPVFIASSNNHQFVFVTDPILISNIYKQSKSFAMSPLQAMWMKSIFGFEEHIIVSPVMGTLMDNVHRHLTPRLFTPLIQGLVSNLCLRSNNAARYASVATGLFPFIRNIAFESSSTAFFGTPFHSLESLFWDFDKDVPRVAFGYPPSYIQGFEQSREYLINHLETYLLDPDHTTYASELIMSTESIAKNELWPTRMTARFLLGLLWPLMGNAPYAIYWLLALQTKHPKGLAPLVKEIDEARKEFKSLRALLEGNPALPWMEAAIQETMRFASSSYSLRRVVEEDGVLLGAHPFQFGEDVVCVTRSVHMNPTIYNDPSVYQPERFLAPDMKLAIPSSGYLPFGGGASICEGRHYARAKIRVLLMFLLTEYEFQLVDVPHSHWSFAPNNRGFGMIRPQGDVFVSVKPRTGVL